MSSWLDMADLLDYDKWKHEVLPTVLYGIHQSGLLNLLVKEISTTSLGLDTKEVLQVLLLSQLSFQRWGRGRLKDLQ